MKTVFVDRTSVVNSVDEVSRLTEIGECVVHQNDPENAADVLARLADATVAITAHTMIDRAVIDALPTLQLVLYLGVGAGSYVDLQAARKAGLTVANTPNYGDQAVAEHTLALLLAVARQIVPGDRAMRQGLFPRDLKGMELRGKTVGVVGTGGIGTVFAGIAKSLGMTVIAWTRTPSPERAGAIGIRYVPIDELFGTADIVSVHLAPHPETRGFVNRDLLGKMHHGAIFLNTSRGEIVDNVALAELLRSGHLLGAGLDVFDPEPPDPSDPLLQLSNVVLTPHVGYSTGEAIARMREIAVDTVFAFAQGTPRNVVI